MTFNTTLMPALLAHRTKKKMLLSRDIVGLLVFGTLLCVVVGTGLWLWTCVLWRQEVKLDCETT